jgi:hypothetical protein
VASRTLPTPEREERPAYPGASRAGCAAKPSKDPKVPEVITLAVKNGTLPLPSVLRKQLKEAVEKGELDEEKVEEIWQRILPTLRQAARINVNFFCELVATNDETGEPIAQSESHKKWAELAEQYSRLLIWSHIESAKTTQLSILRTVWELGKDPTLRFAILSNTKGQAEQILRSIALLIERNEEVHAIFPELKPDPAGPWTNSKLRVVRPGSAKDASVRAVGVHGDLTGARVDRLIVDDILDPENCETEAARKKLTAWYKAVAAGRLTGRARVLVVGTAYHPKDLLHELAAMPGWKWFRFPVLYQDGPKKGQSRWPQQWPMPRIENKKAELGPAEFARQMLCLARDDAEARFKQEWIDLALRAGDGLRMLDRVDLDDLEEGAMIFTGVDLAARKTRRSDLTVFTTFLQDKKGRRRLLDIQSGKFTGPQIINTIKQLHTRYRSIFVVESNAAQQYIVQFLEEDTDIPVVPFTTGRNKRDPIFGVEGIAIDLSNGRWVFPNVGGRMHPELEKLIEEMLFYTPGKHTGDRLMSMWFPCEKARDMMGATASTVGQVTVRVLGDSVSSGQDSGLHDFDAVSWAEQQKIYSDSSFTTMD